MTLSTSAPISVLPVSAPPSQVGTRVLLRNRDYTPSIPDGEPIYKRGGPIPLDHTPSLFEHMRAPFDHVTYTLYPEFQSHPGAYPFRFPAPDSIVIHQATTVSRESVVDTDVYTNLYDSETQELIDVYVQALRLLQQDPAQYGPFTVANAYFNLHYELPLRYHKVWVTTSNPYGGILLEHAAVMAYTEQGFCILAVLEECLGHDSEQALFVASVRNMYRDDFVLVIVPIAFCPFLFGTRPISLNVSQDLAHALQLVTTPWFTFSPLTY